MPRYAISFRFLDDAGAAARRDSLLREIARCPRFWIEAGSIALVETTEPLAELEARLYLDSTLNAQKDWLLVLEVAGAAAGRGRLADADRLRLLLPDVTLA